MVLRALLVDAMSSLATVVEVKSAYGENTIISKGLGVKATKEQIAQAKADELAKVAAAAAALKRAQEAKSTLMAKYGSKGLLVERMFSLQGEMEGGAVTADEVAQDLSRGSGLALEAFKVTMDPIEAIGESVVAAVELHPEVVTSVKVVLQKSKITRIA
jgi:ribosomal protein L9